jgi:CBS domain-containing protein
MSARAAWRLESLGFDQVFRYVAGKADWVANGLPTEGAAAGIPRAGDVARRDVPTCGLSDRVSDVRERLQASGWGVCVVVNEERVVLGRLRGKALDAPVEARAEDVMEEGPTTIRPNTFLEEIIGRLHDRRVDSILVTNTDGQLLGLLDRTDAERRRDEFHARAATSTASPARGGEG